MKCSSALGRVLAAGFLALAACDNDDGRRPANTGGNNNSTEGSRDERSPFLPENDLEFIDGMLPHHEMGVMMAQMVVERGSDPAVRAIATEIRDTQTREAEQMRAARRELAGSDAVEPVPDAHADNDQVMMMSASGVQLDVMFLANIIPHHGAAIQMSHYALPNLQRADMRTMAASIEDDQARQIGELHAMLDRLRG